MGALLSASFPVSIFFIFRSRRCCRLPNRLFLLLLFSFFSFIFLCWLYSNSFTSNSSLPQCRQDQQLLANLYQLHSLPPWPRPEPTPLNWLPLRLSTVPRPERLCSLPKSASLSPFSRCLVVVHSHRAHFGQRQTLRLQLQQNGLLAVFVLATADASPSELAELEQESGTNGDLLLLASLAEQYRLLAHKTRAWIDWLARLKCSPRPRFLLKMDDDVLVNWPALGRLLHRVGPKPRRLVLCRTIVGGQISRNPASKWFLSSQEFRSRPQGLGLYCQGLALLLSWDLVAVAAANLRSVQFLWMDDWYLSHALLAGSGATFVDISPHIHNIDLLNNVPEPAITSAVHYPPIFAHFRPADKFPIKRRLMEWKRLLGQKAQGKCSL